MSFLGVQNLAVFDRTRILRIGGWFTGRRVLIYESDVATSRSTNKDLVRHGARSRLVDAVKQIWAISLLVCASGCSGGAERPTPASPRPLTFTRDIAPIVFTHCAPCHRPGQAAPFSLLTYADVRAELDEIAGRARAIGTCRRGCPSRATASSSDRAGCRDDTLATLQRWVARGSGRRATRAICRARQPFRRAGSSARPISSSPRRARTPLRPGDDDVFRNLVLPGRRCPLAASSAPSSSGPARRADPPRRDQRRSHAARRGGATARTASRASTA